MDNKILISFHCYILYLFPFLFLVNKNNLNQLLIFCVIVAGLICLKLEGISSIDQNGAVVAIITGPILLLARYFFNSQFCREFSNLYRILKL